MKKYKNISELKACPYCGNDEYIIYSRVSGKTSFRYNFNKDIDADNSEMYSCLMEFPEKFVYCGKCYKKIARNDIDY